VILGQTGLGKTRLVMTLVRSSRQASSWPTKILVADPQAEYGNVAIPVQSIEEWAQYVEQARGVWTVAYQGDDLDTALPAICDAVFDMGPIMLVLEEADLWCTPNQIMPEVAKLLKYGRKRQVWVCGVARRPSEVHRLLTSQARHVIAFGTVEPIDVEYFRRGVSVEFAAAVQQLDLLEAAWWDRRERKVQRLRVDPQMLSVVEGRPARGEPSLPSGSPQASVRPSSPPPPQAVDKEEPGGVT
jgi:hypothetical protein